MLLIVMQRPREQQPAGLEVPLRHDRLHEVHHQGLADQSFGVPAFDPCEARHKHALAHRQPVIGKGAVLVMAFAAPIMFSAAGSLVLMAD